MAITFVCDVCQSEYTLKDELAGKRVRCKSCQNILVVPDPVYALADGGDDAPYDVGTPAPTMPGRAPRYPSAFNRDKFLVNQKKLTINEKYVVTDEQKRPILFIERKLRFWRQVLMVFGGLFALLGTMFVTILLIAMLGGKEGPGSPVGGAIMFLGFLASFVAMIAAIIALAPRRNVEIYADESRSDLLLRVYQDHKFSLLNATYTVATDDDTVLGSLHKNYLYNFIRKRWYVRDPEATPYLVVKEDSIILSLMRRFLGPLFGFLRTNFIIMPIGSDRVIGEFNRKFTLFDRYVLDLTADREHRLDRRLGVALAVMLDTGERR